MAFKMKRKGFPMKSGPNKIRDYSSAMDMKKEESPNKRLDIGVTRDGEEIMYDIDRGTETGQTRSRKVQDALKYERENQRMKDRNVKRAEDEYNALMDEMQEAGRKVSAGGEMDRKRIDEIQARLKEIEQGKNVEGGESLYDIKYSGEDARQRKLLDQDRYSYERGKGSTTYPVGSTHPYHIEGVTDDAGTAGMYIYDEEGERYTDQKLRDERKKRLEAADSPAGMKSGFKMKSPIKRANVNVYRGDQEFLYGTGDDVNTVTDETKKAMEFEKKNENIIAKNADKYSSQIEDLDGKIREAEESGNTKMVEQLEHVYY